MELNLSHEVIRLNEVVFDNAVEQSIEHEYQLPDYYPGIFKMLKCSVEPHIRTCRTSGNQLLVDGNVLVKILYTDEEEGIVHSIEQHLSFSKNIELKSELNNPKISCDAQTEYMNCRIISPRKIDLRGALTLHIKATTQNEEMVLSDADGAGVQLNHKSVTISKEQQYVCRQFNVSDQISLNSLAEEILDIKVFAIAESCKLIANKAITKGTAYVHILYRPVDSSEPINFDTTFPISQIADINGVDEDYICDVKYEVTSVDSNKVQEGSVLDLNLDVTMSCYAFLKQEVQTVVDAYSTKYELKTTTKEMNSPAIIDLVRERLISNQAFDQAGIKKLLNCTCKITDLSGTQKENMLEFTARLNITMFAINHEDEMEIIEKTVSIEFEIASDIEGCDKTEIDAKANVITCECSLSGDRVDLKASIYLQGTVSCQQNIQTISDIVLDENQPLEKPSVAMTLFYPEKGDSVWDIAKRFLTSPSAIMEANGLTESVVKDTPMLMIPMV